MTEIPAGGAPRPSIEQELTTVLAAYGAKRIVVGHTPNLKGIQVLNSGKLVTIVGLLGVALFMFELRNIDVNTSTSDVILATLIRGVLVPATLRVLGRIAWYAPSPLRRVYGRVALSEG